MNKSAVILLCLSLLSAPLLVLADAAVIVHPSNPVELSQAQLRSLFLGKRSMYPGAGEARVFLPESPSEARMLLLKHVVGRSEVQLMAFWSQLRFTGRGTVPVVLSDEDESIKKLIAKKPSAISVISASQVDDSIRVIRWLKDESNNNSDAAITRINQASEVKKNN
ncbi:MAG: phosphate ABC transporter substrate-binding protein [Cellvibrionaceae bacterium]